VLDETAWLLKEHRLSVFFLGQQTYIAYTDFEYNSFNNIKWSISYLKLGDNSPLFSWLWRNFTNVLLTPYNQSWIMQKKSLVDDPMVAFLVKGNSVKCIANLHVFYAASKHVHLYSLQETVSLTLLSSYWNRWLFDGVKLMKKPVYSYLIKDHWWNLVMQSPKRRFIFIC